MKLYINFLTKNSEQTSKGPSISEAILDKRNKGIRRKRKKSCVVQLLYLTKSNFYPHFPTILLIMSSEKSDHYIEHGFFPCLPHKAQWFSNDHQGTEGSGWQWQYFLRLCREMGKVELSYIHQFLFSLSVFFLYLFKWWWGKNP